MWVGPEYYDNNNNDINYYLYCPRVKYDVIL